MLIGSRDFLAKNGVGLPSIAPSNLPAPPGPAPKEGVFDRIGSFLQSDEGRATLLRSGAATLQGGLGAGIEAGIGYHDQQQQRQQQTQQQQFENSLATLKQQTDAAHKAATANQVHYQAVPEGGTLVGMHQDGSFVDPTAASRFVAGGAQPAPPAAPAGPAVGTVQRGFRFRGGDPSSPQAWEQVGGAPSQGGAIFR